MADPLPARYPFDAASVKANTASTSPASDEPPLRYRMRRHIHTLSFLSPSAVLVLALFLLASLHGIGLLLFSRGFLLTRLALETTNDCNPTDANGRIDASCSLPPTHSKLVLIIIDALRADFVLPVNADVASPFYSNHITLPSLLTSQRPTHSFLAHFIADAPTTTLQRLKGLTTGSLPTFVDAGSNFGGEKVAEDNWLAQAKRAGKKIAMVGDDTWLNVFPRGNESVWDETNLHPYDSFNVEDLDTVDRGVVQHLLPLLERKEEGTKEWDIVIAHALGLDHSGHRFGPSHPEATRKLKETQRLLEQVVERLEEDTLLVVMGDHGMTERGDHGGDSRDEVEAALWIYSKGATLTDSTWFDHPTTSIRHPLAKLFNSSASANDLGDRMELEWTERGLERTRAVSQVDIVPTLSLLLGLPIPFGNLGLVIPDIFYHTSTLPVAPGSIAKNPKAKRSFFSAASNPTEDALSPLQTLLQASLLTSSQLSYYLHAYTSTSSGSDLLPSMPELTFILSLAKSAYRGAHAPGAGQTEMETLALEKFWQYGRKTREKARLIWARFDPVLIVAGLFLWGGSGVVGFRLYEAAANGGRARFLVGRALEGALLAGWLTTTAWMFSAFEWIGGLPVLWIAFVVAFGAEVGVLLAPAVSGRSLVSRLSPTNWTSLLPLIAHCALFASNSFTAYEDDAVLFILSTILLLTLLRAISAPERRLRNRLVGFSIVALVCVRLMSYSTICREEQAPFCTVTFYLPAGSNGALAVIVLALVAAWFLPTALRRSLSLSAADTALAPVYLGYAVRGLLVVGVGYWAVDWAIAGLGLEARGIAFASIIKTSFARVVLVGSILLSTLVWYYTPLCLTVQREAIRDASGKEIRTQVKFIGFANAFGSAYLLFLASIFTLLFLVSPPPAQIVLTLQFITLLCFLEIFDSERDVAFLRSSFSSESLESLLDSDLPTPPSHTGPSFLQLSTLALLAHLSFFSTGHQATLSSIQWSTAFIGFPTLLYPFSPALVILNTTSSHILTALSIPLFVFWTLSPTLKDQPPIFVLRNLLRASVGYTTYQGVVSCAAALFAAVLRRNLFVWKVFAPRFMAGSLCMLCIDVAMVGAVGWGALGTVGKVRGTLGTKVAE